MKFKALHYQKLIGMLSAASNEKHQTGQIVNVEGTLGMHKNKSQFIWMEKEGETGGVELWSEQEGFFDVSSHL